MEFVKNLLQRMAMSAYVILVIPAVDVKILNNLVNQESAEMDIVVKQTMDMFATVLWEKQVQIVNILK